MTWFLSATKGSRLRSPWYLVDASVYHRFELDNRFCVPFCAKVERLISELIISLRGVLARKYPL